LVRFGALSPQLYANGGARFLASWRVAWIWFFDPDVGLFPNWWIGVLAVAFAIWVLVRRRNVVHQPRASRASRASRAEWTAFLVVYVGSSLAANSSTLNLNAGGTPSVSRYVIWYVPLFFPPVVGMVGELARFVRARFRPRGSVALAAAGVAALWLAGRHAHALFRPALSEKGYLRPTRVSRAIQTRFPWAYDPPTEIFAERYGGIDGIAEGFVGQFFAVVGPDCHKVLVLGDYPTARVVAPATCRLDDETIRRAVRRHLESERASTLPSYVRLTDDDARAISAKRE
jgi:hypothetical protein